MIALGPTLTGIFVIVFAFTPIIIIGINDCIYPEGLNTGWIEEKIEHAVSADNIDFYQDYCRKDGYSFQHIAAQKCSLNKVKKLFSNMGMEHIFSTNNQGDTPLLLAVEHDNFKVVKFLTSKMLQKPEYINRCNKWGDTPLDHAICNRQIETVKFLISAVSIEGVIRSGGEIMTIKKDNEIKGWVARYRPSEKEYYVGSCAQKLLKLIFKTNIEAIEKLVNDKLAPFKDLLAMKVGDETSKIIYDYLYIAPGVVIEDEINMAGSLDENENG